MTIQATLAMRPVMLPVHPANLLEAPPHSMLGGEGAQHSPLKHLCLNQQSLEV